jgi:drug/metabolite transporter (DMT)-like permease
MAAVFALVSSLMWGTSDFLAGKLTKSRVAFAVAGAGQIVGLIFVAVLTVATAAWVDVPIGSYLPWAVLGSFAGLTGLICFYQALATGSMSVVSPIAGLSVLVPLAFGLWDGERPTSWQYAGIALAIIGVLLAATPEITGEVGLRPVVLAAVAALMFGIFLVCLAIGAESSVLMTMTAQRATSVVIVLIVAITVRSVGGLRRSDTPLLAVIGVLDVGANLLFGLAATLGLLAVVAVLGSLYPVVTVILAWIVLGERLKAIQYVGVVLALLGVAAISAG